MSRRRPWTRRERLIAMALGLLLSLWALDQWFLEPILQARQETDRRLTRNENEQAKANRLIAQGRSAQRTMNTLRQNGLFSDASLAENQMLSAIRQWAFRAGLKLSSIRPDRAVASLAMRELVLEVNAEGSMRSITDLIYRLETASFPLRIRELKISARTEDSDDLSLQLRVSTLWDESTGQRLDPSLKRSTTEALTP